MHEQRTLTQVAELFLLQSMQTFAREKLSEAASCSLAEGFSPKDGQFTAPRKGLYQFTLHSTTKRFISFFVYKNGDAVRDFPKNQEHHGLASTDVFVLDLKVGDQVFINVWPGGNTGTDTGVIVGKKNPITWIGEYKGMDLHIN